MTKPKSLDEYVDIDLSDCPICAVLDPTERADLRTKSQKISRRTRRSAAPYVVRWLEGEYATTVTAEQVTIHLKGKH